MPNRDFSIRRKLTSLILATSGLVLLVTCTAFFAYEFLTFRQTAERQLSILGAAIATNSTASLAFANADDARDVLAALRADPSVVAGVLYDDQGRQFASYPSSLSETVPATPGTDGYRFDQGRLIGFQPVVEGTNRRLGTLYLAADLGGLYARLQLYAVVALLVILASLVLAYPLSRRFQKGISQPILALAEVAKAVSQRQDYSVRAERLAGGELGMLTDAFNHMLAQIQEAEGRLRTQVARLDLLNRITRAIADRLDLPSVFRVVIGTLEADMPIDFGCVCVYDPALEVLTVAGLGQKSRESADAMGTIEDSTIPTTPNGLERCIRGDLVYQTDTTAANFPLAQKLAGQGLRSLVAAPLLVESQVFGVLLAARREPNAFSSPDCEFLRQLSAHVALASHQTQIHTALRDAFDELRQSQQTVLQQERLRALGQMASGIAHDINNAISPVALYTQSLLEKEPNLSPRARDYLQTIDRAIEDVASTVARMREFYRQREPQLTLAPADLNGLVKHVMDLTRARWSDMPQQRGVVVETKTELTPNLPSIMGAEGEIRDALTNLIFNAVDAMPDGGTLTIRTKLATKPATAESPAARSVQIEVSDTGLGMDEETRRRCLEPFFTTKGERGTGLGLAMVYGMVQRHSADIEIDSAPGKGTTVRVGFIVSAAIESGQASATFATPSRMRILVVDDDPLLIKSLRDTLESDGHEIVTANGGQQGIDTFKASVARKEPFAVVITDLGMPHVDGRRVASEVKNASAQTPVIMLTGWGQRLLADNEIPEHVDHLLSKPPRLHALREALARCVDVGQP